MIKNWKTIVESLSVVNQNTVKKRAGLKGKIFYRSQRTPFPKSIFGSLSPWQIKKINSGQGIVFIETQKGPLWFVQMASQEDKQHYGVFSTTQYSQARESVASLVRRAHGLKLSSLEVEYFGESEEELLGLGAGLEMASYSFKNCWPVVEKQPLSVVLKSTLKSHKILIKEIQCLGKAVNLSRFLVDAPPNLMNPDSFVAMVKAIFPATGPMKKKIWSNEQLKKEKMGLHLAVGQGSEFGTHLVQLQYRGGRGKSSPVAFVGKGITFDTGGLDIKPASGMRLMKKDMGGAASLLGLAYWVSQAKPKLSCDFYLALAENSIGERSFRPSDILQSRSGTSVEIHNTDAEGRLVLADSLTLAAESQPQLIVDVATLTGAVKYGIGSKTPGLFSNRDNLAEVLLQSCKERGEAAWRLPLIPSERSRLRSDVADMVNCTDGYGGAVTAALFLESFVQGTPWAHFDIYSWVDRPQGVYGQSGGSGQLVQSLSHFILTQCKNIS